MNIIDIIIWLIGGCALVAFLCGVRAIVGIRVENRKLKKQADLQKCLLGNNKTRKDREKSLEKWIDQEQEKMKRKDVAVGRGHHLLLRMKTIYESITRTDAKVMPSLHDLHMITVQDEMSRLSSTTLRSISSFLLIVGILGTLWGVHSVLQEVVDLKVSSLRPALVPSMYAVGCTVVLMWLRGLYLARFDSYLEKLDLFTMTKIIPLLQPMSRVAGASDDLNAKVTNIEEQINSIGNASIYMEELCKSVKTISENVQGVSNNIHEVFQQVNAKSEDIEKEMNLSKERFSEINEAISKTTRKGEEMKQMMKKLKMNTVKFKEHFNATKGQMSQTVYDLEKVFNYVKEKSGVVAQINEDVVMMQKMNGIISQYGNSISEMQEDIKNVNKAFDELSKLAETMNKSESAVMDSSVSAKAVLDEFSSQNAEFKEHNKQFENDSETGSLKIKNELQRLEEKNQELSTAIQNIEDKIQERSNLLHV